MDTICINDITLEYRDSRKESDGKSPAGENLGVLLFVHGAGGALEQFSGQHECFSSRYRVVSVSLRGHGGSGEPAEPGKEAYSLPEMAGELEAFIEALGLGPVHYVGNSAGGVLGFDLASRRPDLMASLTTFGTVARMAFPEFLRRFTFWYDTKTASGNAEKKLRTAARYISRKPPVRSAAAAMFLKAARSFPYYRHALGSYDYLDQVRSLPCPCALIRGSLDRDINIMLGSTLRALKAQAALTGLPGRVLELPGAGHLANLDAPEGFNALLEEWLETVDRSRQPEP